MLRRALGDYGIPAGGYTNLKAVVHPEKQLDASVGNKFLEDIAQLTRTGARGLIRFTTRGTNGNATQSYAMTMWGEGIGFYATTIARSAPGVYLVTLPTTMPNSFSAAEPVNVIDCWGDTDSLTECGFVKASWAANLITLNLRSTAAALTDFTAGTTSIKLLWF